MNDADQTSFVTTAFHQAGLTPSESELTAFVAAYAGIRSFLDSLYYVAGRSVRVARAHVRPTKGVPR